MISKEEREAIKADLKSVLDGNRYLIGGSSPGAIIHGLASVGMDLVAELEQLTEWVNDLQSGMYINCVYCGHRYGPDSEINALMQDVLKKHVERCQAHPMSALKAEVERRGTLIKHLIPAFGPDPFEINCSEDPLEHPESCKKCLELKKIYDDGDQEGAGA